MKRRAACLAVLPEECVSVILSFTSPRDACRLSLTSSEFSSAALSESVWERFLPSDYEEIISRSVAPVVFTSMRDLFFRLCDSPILLRGSAMSFALDKGTGKKCYMLGSRELSIARGNTQYQWRWTRSLESRNSEAVEYGHGCRLDDIQCKMETHMLSPNTTYAAYFVYKLLTNGFEYYPVYASVKFVKGGGRGDIYAVNRAFLTSRTSTHVPIRQYGQLPRERRDGWMEIEMGEFFNDHGHDNEVELLVKGSKVLNFRLIVQGIELRPKEGK
uniref:Putative F-box protein PP2-B10-like n=1 Tax=Davidia involucrata TaxID=16924 RepID=A0A5B7BLC7_DAVIN